jgi:Protein of unknwon function (DUF3310)
MVAGIVEAMAGQVERALKQQEEEKMIHAEIPRIYAGLENEMVKGPTKPLYQNETRGLKPEQYAAWEQYIKEEYTDAENELVKETEKRESAEKKANDYQVGGSHYKDKRVQPWDVVDAGSHQQAIGYYRWSALAYIMRAGDKGPAKEDYEKAKHYLTKLLEIL